ncbi:rCG60275, isoform CRA_b [Rattus norvegicus]|uniref:RCG60275, isoform CRA_b n=1 Tax=Rattus norvegicus TaxID=10116 RepID=A6HRS5_RAT|nr:rCG60275, isoform CRA_b [Rattus norvegicus]
MPMPYTTVFRFLLWLTLEFSYRKCDQIRDT